MCGGTSSANALGVANEGLSPRVRGNLVDAIQAFVMGRSIPACAGEPGFATIDRRAGRVYPRVCGGTRRRPAALVAR